MENNRRIKKLICLFALTYFASYVTRLNFGAVISAILQSTGLSKPMLSMAVTGSFVSYGIGQLVSGMCGDRFSPKKLVALGLAVSSAMNLLIPLCADAYQMTAVWCVNGFAQSFIWPPLVKIMSSVLSEDAYRMGIVRVQWGCSLGTIAIYLVSPVLISAFDWRAVFLVSSICGLSVVCLWNKAAPDPVRATVSMSQKRSGQTWRGLLEPYVFFIMFAIVMMGMLRDGVTTWMPSYISETYSLSSAVSILSGGILPVFSILSCQIGSGVYRKLKNVLLCAVLFFGLGGLAAAAMVLSAGKQAAVSVICAAVLTGSMHGVNLMLISMIPPYFKKYGNVSMASGVLNSCTYVGSAVSTYGIAVMSDGWGWNVTLLLWILMAVLGLLGCAAAMRPWKEHMETNTVM